MSAIISRRSTDAMLSIYKDVANRSILITAANRPFLDMTGYQDSELLAQNFSRVLPPEINNILKEDLEFNEEDIDLTILLQRISKFHIVTKDGKQMPVKVKVFATLSEGNKLHYDLLFTDISLQLQLAKMREAILAKRGDETIEQELGIFSSARLLRDLEIVGSLVTGQIKSCFVMVKLDSGASLQASLGESKFNELLKEVGQRILKNVREDDVVGYLGEDKFGIILFNCSIDNARIAINRIRWRVMVEPANVEGQSVTFSISASFKELDSRYSPRIMLNACEAAIRSNSEDMGSMVYQA